MCVIVGQVRPPKTLLIVVDGNIGHLKSTLLKKLREGANILVIEGKISKYTPSFKLLVKITKKFFTLSTGQTGDPVRLICQKMTRKGEGGRIID